MDKRILLPTDFSRNALNAIRYALDLYANQTCDFYFLNAYQVSGYSIDSMMVPEPGERAYEMAKKESEAGFVKLMDILELHNDDPKHTYHTISTFNSLLYAIKTTIAKKDIDIVVMGTKGATGAEDVIFGTNTVDAMEKVTECPVLAIPDNVRFAAPKEIVFPTDFKTSFKRRELNYLLEIAKHHHAAIRVLHIAEKSELNREQLSNRELLQSILEDVDYSFHTLTDLGVQTGISAFIDSRGSDMIAFVNRKHSFLGSLFSRPLVKEMGYYSKIPVLTLHDVS
ncbi:universal stress protein [Flavobacteriaceae bacterium TP-CH-4]|uniref:Universal stress protein n=1 Tax=Pelagihabitans pacificus TaxID=2696054 RepID=A0A967APP5_9FLAO|nr:universal stress protein [Pelagihabitans pacificus]NHF57727.1 universal stress protein [Pelagihabitans pacificus]